jgi:diguanylate cyclase (GGDEF)-like protein
MAGKPKVPSQKELQSRIDSLQAEVTRFIVVKQELIDTQGLLDREENRFKGIQACSEQLLHAEDMETFTTVLLESILATFEFEVSLFTRYDSHHKRLDVIGQAGFTEPPTSLPFDIDDHEGNTGIILPAGHALLKKWAATNLGEAIICPYFSEKDHSSTGLVIGGLTTENLDHYEPINSEVISSFSVMVAQAGSLLRNYELKKKLQEQNLELEDYSKNLESLVEERTRELQQSNKQLDLLYQQSVGHLQVTREELSYQELLAQTDELTGLYNRRCMEAQLRRHVELSESTDDQFGLLLSDLDNFKLVNDTYGHPQGDVLLKTVAQVFRDSCRHTDLICRLGGDEFAVIMPGISTTRGREVAEQIRSRIALLPAVERDCGFKVTASLGGTLHMPSEGANELVSRVDEYLYQAKRNGRNRVVWKEKTPG